MKLSPNYLRTNYTPFYLTMLILSTIGTLVGLYGLTSVPGYIENFSNAQIYSLANIFMALIVTPVSAIALVLLWRKHSLGIWLKLNTYGASIVSYLVLMLFTEESVIQKIAKQTSAELADTPGISQQFIDQAAQATYYTAIVISIIASVAFAILWWTAWKRQAMKDGVDA